MRGLMFGGSMKPHMGLVNFVYGVKPDVISVGDIVCFSRPDKAMRLIHRVVDVDGSGNVYIKGDNAKEVDCVPLSAIHYKIIKFRKLL